MNRFLNLLGFSPYISQLHHFFIESPIICLFKNSWFILIDFFNCKCLQLCLNFNDFNWRIEHKLYESHLFSNMFQMTWSKKHNYSRTYSLSIALKQYMHPLSISITKSDFTSLIGVYLKGTNYGCFSASTEK